MTATIYRPLVFSAHPDMLSPSCHIIDEGLLSCPIKLGPFGYGSLHSKATRRSQ